MAKAELRRNTRVYHSIVAILILLSGAGLLGVGIWLRFSDNGDLFDLDYSGEGNRTLEAVLRTDVAAMITGSFLILSGIISLIALSKNCVGYTFRIIYMIFAIIIFAALVAIAVLSIIFLTRKDDADVKKFFSDAWESSVGDNGLQEDVSDGQKVICSIEKTFECRGFEDNDCTNCKTGLEPTCDFSNSRCAVCADTNPGADPTVGCYSEITDALRSVFLPAGIVSGILAIVVLIDIFFVCCL